MRISALLFYFIIVNFQGFSQSSIEVLNKVLDRQRKLKAVSYTIQRTDTLVTDVTRTMTGSVKIKVVPADTIFGFWFWAKKDGVNTEDIYDGHSALNIDHDKRTYNAVFRSSDMQHTLGRPGGQVVLVDLIRLDTNTAKSFTLKDNNTSYDLEISLPDITKYDVTRRYKKVTIDKKTMLPVAVRYHQETLGKVQDLYYKITSIKLDEQADRYDFSAQRFPGDYKPAGAEVRRNRTLLKKQLPSFTGSLFDGSAVTSGQFVGKVILLDFWAVWCGPCLESMPKVQILYEKFRQNGFEVYGVITERDRLETANKLIKKINVNFPMLVCDKAIEELFQIDGVPTYILIDKKGQIAFITEGYSPVLEEEIKKLVG